MFEKQSLTFVVTMAFMLLSIICIARVASTFGKSKPSRQYCLEFGKQKATLKLLKFALNGEIFAYVT